MSKITIKTEKLEEINDKGSDITQKTAEAVGTLQMIDTQLEEVEHIISSDVLWALRNAIRNLESIIKNDSLKIVEIVEELQRGDKNV